jgi:hypothetical protein
MLRIRLSAIIFLGVAFCAFTFSGRPEVSDIKAGKGTRLFNGKDLTGWKIYGSEKWYVEKGELICESGPDKQYGYLGTEKHYKDFDLTLQFLQESAGNSGVFFRANIEGTKIKGWQVEVAPPNHDSGGIYESGWGRGWLAKIPDERENILKYGQWNKLRVRVVGGKATTWLNGEQMVDINNENIAAASGSIALQIHDGGGIKVRWKNLRIQEL